MLKYGSCVISGTAGGLSSSAAAETKQSSTPAANLLFLPMATLLYAKLTCPLALTPDSINL